MGLLKKMKMCYYQYFAENIKIKKDDHTPILFESYDTQEYYYIINNNMNNIYSLDEIYELLKSEKPIDPFTRMPVKNWSFVRVSY